MILSNIFMTFAWYGHLKHLNSKPWFVAALVSWGIAFFEYMLHAGRDKAQLRMGGIMPDRGCIFHFQGINFDMQNL
jgi:hypothetical protein